MSLVASIAAASEGAGHVVTELPIPSFMYGAIAFLLFTALAFVTFTFRDVANRHAHKTAAADAHGHDGHGAGH